VTNARNEASATILRLCLMRQHQAAGNAAQGLIDGRLAALTAELPALPAEQRGLESAVYPSESRDFNAREGCAPGLRAPG
jgi:hypothetical protein